MKKNLSTMDRVIRVVLALIGAALFFADIATGTLGTVVLLVGAIFLLTSAVGFCPIYRALNLSTLKSKTPA